MTRIVHIVTMFVLFVTESIILLSSALTNGRPLNWMTTLENFENSAIGGTTETVNLITAAEIGYCPLVR